MEQRWQVAILYWLRHGHGTALPHGSRHGRDHPADRLRHGGRRRLGIARRTLCGLHGYGLSRLGCGRQGQPGAQAQERGGTRSRPYCRQPALPPLDGVSGRTLPAHHRLRPARQNLHGRDARHVAFARLLAQRRRGTLRLLARQQGDLLHLESGPPPGGFDQLRPLDGLRHGRRGKMSDQGEPGMGRTAALFARWTLHRLPLPDRAQL